MIDILLLTSITVIFITVCFTNKIFNSAEKKKIKDFLADWIDRKQLEAKETARKNKEKARIARERDLTRERELARRRKLTRELLTRGRELARERELAIEQERARERELRSMKMEKERLENKYGKEQFVEEKLANEIANERKEDDILAREKERIIRENKEREKIAREKLAKEKENELKLKKDAYKLEKLRIFTDDEMEFSFQEMHPEPSKEKENAFSLYLDFFKKKYPEVDQSEAQKKWDSDSEIREKYQMKAMESSTTTMKYWERLDYFKSMYPPFDLKWGGEIMSDLDLWTIYWIHNVNKKKDLSIMNKVMIAYEKWLSLDSETKRQFFYEAHEKIQFFFKHHGNFKEELYPEIHSGRTLFFREYDMSKLKGDLPDDVKRMKLLKEWNDVDQSGYHEMAKSLNIKSYRKFSDKHQESIWVKNLKSKDLTKFLV